MFPRAILSNSSINQSFSVGNSTVLECSSEGGPNNTYQWQMNNSNLTGATLPVLVLSNIEASTGGMYTCIVSNAAGSDNTSTSLYVFPYFVTQPTDIEVTNGTSITLLCDAMAFPNPDYQWERAGGETFRGNIETSTQTLVISPVMFGDEGNYYCTASSLNVTIRSENTTVTGNAYPRLRAKARAIARTIRFKANDIP